MTTDNRVRCIAAAIILIIASIAASKWGWIGMVTLLFGVSFLFAAALLSPPRPTKREHD